MKKIILVLAAVSASIFALAQDNGNGKKTNNPKLTAEQRAQKSVDGLDKIVTLTAEQKTSVYNLALTRAKKVDELRAKHKGQKEGKDALAKELKQAKTDYRSGVKQLLTEEQKNKLKEHHKNNKDKKLKKGAKTTVPSAEPALEEIIPDGE
jgi:periplasmic protein CpxP/Spy